MKKLLIVLCAALVCAILFSAAAWAEAPDTADLPAVTEAEQEAAVKVSAANFPDAVLRKYVSNNFDKDGNGSLSEAEIKAVTVFDLTNSGVTNLKGIALFPNLKVLKANYLNISKADVSGNPALEELELAYTGVSKVDLKNNKALKRFWVTGSNFTSVDLRDCPNLTWFSCSYSSVASINLSNSKKLKELYCVESNLKSLNLSNCSALQVLDCCFNAITSLKVSGCPSLRELHIDGTGITSLNLSKNTALTTFTASKTPLTSLDLSKNTKLDMANLRNSKLTSLTLGSNKSLKTLYVTENKLTSLDAGGCSGLEVLMCSHNALTGLKLPQGKALKRLNCSNNALTALDVSGCTGLNSLMCSDNDIAALNVKNCTKLEVLDAAHNRLTKLDLSRNTKLTNLYVPGNHLAALDLTKNTVLNYFDVSGNYRSVTAEAGKIFYADLDIDDDRVSGLNGASAGSSAFTVSKSGKVTYTYKMANGKSTVFTLNATYKKGEISSVTIPAEKYAYTGKAIKPAVTVKARISGRTVKLTKGTHYKVYYKDNVSVGTATITVKGTGHYKGTLTKTFKVTRVKLASLTLSQTTMTYTGTELKPKVTVKAKVNGATKTLEKGVDYTVKYKNNVKKGTATVTVTGIGNFTGTLTKTFTIK